VEAAFCELRLYGVLRSSLKIFLDLAHLSDTRKAHQLLHWARSLRRRERLGKGGVKDDSAVAEELKGRLVRDHPSLRPTDEQVWEIVQTRSYDFEVFDQRYAEVILE
jgi:hypothetical protein